MKLAMSNSFQRNNDLMRFDTALVFPWITFYQNFLLVEMLIE